MRRLFAVVGLMMTVLPVAVVAPAVPVLAAVGTVPSGFADSLVTGSISAPVSVTALPDGRVAVLSKLGQLRIIKNGALLASPAMALTVCTSSERGMLGLAVDPLFSANGLIYVYYTRPAAGAAGGCVNRVSRFTMSGDGVLAGSEVVLLDNIGSPAGNHNGGDVEVGNDGYLYVAVGDGGCDPRATGKCDGGPVSNSNPAAQDLSLLNGKILRISTITGLGAPDNPFVNSPGAADCRVRGNTAGTPHTPCREIFAYGLRNPWRFAFDPNTGSTTFRIDDVGQNTLEEVDQGLKGANYGWPEREGECAQGFKPTDPQCGSNPVKYTAPITDYAHGTGDYVTGGAFVPDGAWDAAYDGGYLFADGDPGKIFFKTAAGGTNYVQPFASGMGGVSDIGFVLEASGWALYYVNPSTNEVRRITFATSPAASPGGLAYHPATPTRVFDTRNLGADTGPMRAGTSRLVNVVGSQGDHREALVNLTLIRPWHDAFVSVWQPRTTRPASSNLNVGAGAVSANASIVPIDADGNIVLFSNATAHVLVDVLGFFDVTSLSQATAGRLVPVTPVRAVDTRRPADPSTNDYGTSAAGGVTTINVPLAGKFGVTTASSAVVLAVTGLAGSSVGSGFLTAYSHELAAPVISNLNTSGFGDLRSNLVVVPLGADGSVDIDLHNVEKVLVDVVGTFTDGTAALDSRGVYVPVTPTRVVDTRSSVGFSRLAADGIGTVNPSVAPDSAIAITQNIVLLHTGGRGFLTTYPSTLDSVPGVSNANSNGAGDVRSVLSVTAQGTTGAVSYFVSTPADVLVDVTGYFMSATA